MKQLNREKYEEIKKATTEKILIDRPIRDIAEDFGISPSTVVKIKRSNGWADFKISSIKSTLRRYGVTDDELSRFLERQDDVTD